MCFISACEHVKLRTNDTKRTFKVGEDCPDVGVTVPPTLELEPGTPATTANFENMLI